MNEPIKLFLVIPANAINKINLAETLENNQSNLKYNADHTKTYISWWSNNAPSTLGNLVGESIEGPYYVTTINTVYDWS